MWPPGAADAVCPLPRAITKLHRPLHLAIAVDSACSNRLPSLMFVCNTLSVSALITLVTLTFDILTSSLVRVTAHVVGNLPNNFGVSGTFRSRLMG